MKTKQPLAIGLLLLTIFSGFSQMSMSMMTEADRKFKKYAYVDAREIYLKVANEGYKSPDLLKKLGDSYYFDGDLENAMEWYAELVTSYTDYHEDYLFRYAQSLKGMKLYKEAYGIMRKYYYRKGYDPATVLKKSENDYLNLITLQSNRFTLLDFDHNSKDEDFAPQYGQYGDLIFASTRNPSADENDNKKQKGMDFYTLKGNSFKKMDGMINSKFQEASATYTKNKDTVYFTRGKKGGSRKDRHYKTSSPKIYRAVLKNGKWTNIKKLALRSDKHSVMHPTLSPDGKKLYFASDMKGSLGKLDLFVVDIKNNGKLGTPKNLGENINTLGDETFPYIDENGNLYFSSNGHFGLGGLDVFVSEFHNGTYQEPYNLGTPINSIHDDTSLIFDDNSKEGYFASNRKKDTRDLDIYKFKQIKKPITNCRRTTMGRIISSNSLKGISLCLVQLFNEEYEEIGRTTTDEDGFYNFELSCSNVYLIRAFKPSFRTTEEILYVETDYEKEINLTTKLMKGNGLIKTWLTEGENLNDVLGLSTIYFDSNTDRIRSDAKVELQKIIEVLKKNPELKIHIKSHTDNKGNPRHNKNLSQKRAVNTKMYIIKKGHIKSSRIVAQGFGSSNPKVNCNNGCSEDELQINRRSEFVVMN